MDIGQAAYPSYRQARLAIEAAVEEMQACDDVAELMKWMEEKGNEIFGKLMDFDTQTGNWKDESSYNLCLREKWRHYLQQLQLKELTLNLERNLYGN